MGRKRPLEEVPIPEEEDQEAFYPPTICFTTGNPITPPQDWPSKQAGTLHSNGSLEHTFFMTQVVFLRDAQVRCFSSPRFIFIVEIRVHLMSPHFD
jgi:hypothetical protein